MRIIVISEGESLDSYVADDFGHAPYFLLVDSDTLDYHVIVNEYMDAEEGAGMAVAKAIVGLGGVDAVITGGIGMHGIKILQDGGIDVSYDEEGTVEQWRPEKEELRERSTVTDRERMFFRSDRRVFVRRSDLPIGFAGPEPQVFRVG